MSIPNFLTVTDARERVIGMSPLSAKNIPFLAVLEKISQIIGCLHVSLRASWNYNSRSYSSIKSAVVPETKISSDTCLPIIEVLRNINEKVQE